jgi:cell wall-associated NlpC family hydrolase
VLHGNLAFFGRHDAHGYHPHNVGIYLGNDKMTDACQFPLGKDYGC